MSQDQLFVYPTDTVWGIGASIFNKTLQIKIADVKRTEQGKPTSVLFKDLEMLYKYVSLPTNLNLNWETLFQMETTFLIPKECFETVPDWIIYDSPFVGIRVLNLEVFNSIDVPITTTSLNLKGEPPITQYEDAETFKNNYCNDSILVKSNKINLSGQSSTIVKITNESYEFIRKGENFQAIKNELGL